MKFDLSKLSVALMTAGLTLTAATTCFADSHSDRHVVTVPDSQSRYSISVTGLYARATNEDLYFAKIGTTSPNFKSLEHDHDFGGSINASAELNHTGNDLAINWTHLTSKTDGSIKSNLGSTGDLDFTAGRYFVTPSNNTPLDPTVIADSKFIFNEINIEIGQKVDFSQLHTRFHMGLSYAKIDHDFDIKVNQFRRAELPFTDVVTHSTSKFQGLGPRLGVDIAYPITPCNEFAVVAHATGSLLAGKLENDINGNEKSYDLLGNLTSSEKLAVKSDDQYTIVPAATLKVGLRYASSTEPGDCGWSVEGGWTASNYVHSVANTTGFSNTASNTHSSYGNYGFYLTLGYAG